MSIDQEIHPARDMLAAYGLGKLQPDDAVAVETHIAACEECCETLLDLGNDTFADLIRRSDAAQLDGVSGHGAVGLNDIGEDTVCNLPSELTKHPRYRVLELLGRGGMGDVFKAEHMLMNRPVALKLISQKLIRNEQAVDRFRREVQSAAQLAHQNIVTAHDAEQAGDVHFLVMEYVPGDDLSDVVKRDGPLEIGQACDYIRQAANGLQHAHEKGMVHRDVKPHNLMVTSDGQVKILDFGLATLAAEAISNEGSNLGLECDSDLHESPHLTSAGSMMGTPDFISPEQASDARAADVRSDIYSLGCTFYYLLTGRPPFTVGSPMERIKAHGEMEPEPIETIRSDIPSEIANALRRMMAKDPAQRFQTPAEVADALAPFVDAHRTTPISQHEDDSAASTRSSRRSWWPPTFVRSIVGAALAFLLAGVIYIATDNGTLVVESEDDGVEIIIRPATEDGNVGNETSEQMRIVDTVTGSAAKRLRSGEYSVDLKSDDNDFELSQDRFVLRRGGKVIVKVTRKAQRPVAQSVRQIVPVPLPFSAVSQDGRFLALTGWETGDLGVKTLVTGDTLRLTKNDPGSGDFAYVKIWSPDGRQVAASWFRSDERRYELRIYAMDNSEPRSIYSADENHYVHPFAWSATTKQILVGITAPDRTSQLVLIPTAGGSPQPLTSLSWNWPNKASLSLDGRYVVYDMPQESNSPERDIFIVSTDGTFGETLIATPGNDHSPVWSSDGRHVVFVSDRSGSTNPWVLRVENGRAMKPAEKVGIDMNGMTPLGLSQDGSYFYCNAQIRTSNVYTAALNAGDGKLNSRLKVPLRYAGLSSRPAWSLDGTRMAYFSAGQRDSQRLVIRSTESGQDRMLVPHLHRVGASTRPVWSTDGSTLFLADVMDQKQRRRSVSVDVETGEIATFQFDLVRPATAVLSPDGETYCFVRRERDVTRFSNSIVAVSTNRGEQRILAHVAGTKEAAELLSPNAFHSLAISPDGSQLAIASRKSLSIVPLSGGDVQELVQAPRGQEILLSAGVAWMPDGGSLLYGTAPTDKESSYRDPHKKSKLWRVPVSAGAPRDIGLVGDGFSHLAVHPSGKQIAYSAAEADTSKSKGIWALENFLPPLRDGK